MTPTTQFAVGLGVPAGSADPFAPPVTGRDAPYGKPPTEATLPTSWSPDPAGAPGPRR
jgi:hypothetical protein